MVKAKWGDDDGWMQWLKIQSWARKRENKMHFERPTTSWCKQNKRTSILNCHSCGIHYANLGTVTFPFPLGFFYHVHVKVRIMMFLPMFLSISLLLLHCSANHFFFFYFSQHINTNHFFSSSKCHILNKIWLYQHIISLIWVIQLSVNFLIVIRQQC